MQFYIEIQEIHEKELFYLQHFIVAIDICIKKAFRRFVALEIISRELLQRSFGFFVFVRYRPVCYLLSGRIDLPEIFPWRARETRAERAAAAG